MSEELWVDIDVFCDRFFFNNDQTNLILEKRNGEIFSIYRFNFGGTERGFKLLHSNRRHEVRFVDFSGNMLLIVGNERPNIVQIYDLGTNNLIFEISSEDTLKENEYEKSSQVRKAQFLNERSLVILFENGKLKLILLTHDFSDRKREEEEEYEGEEDDMNTKDGKCLQTFHFEALLPKNLHVNNFCVSRGTNIAFSSYKDGDTSNALFFLVKFEPGEFSMITEEKKIDVEKYLTKNFTIVETSVDKVFFSRTNDHVLACSEDGIYFHLYDLSLRKITTFYRGKNAAVVKSISFSDSFVAVLTDRFTLHIFSLNAGDNPRPYLHGISKSYTYETSFSKYYITPPPDENTTDNNKNNKNTEKIGHNYQLCRFTENDESDNNNNIIVFVIGNKSSFYVSFDRTKSGEECKLVEGRVFSGFSKMIKNLKICVDEIYIKTTTTEGNYLHSNSDHGQLNNIHPRSYYFFKLHLLRNGVEISSFHTKSYRGSTLLDRSKTISYYMSMNNNNNMKIEKKSDPKKEQQPKFPNELRMELFRDKTILKDEKLKGSIFITLPPREEFIQNMSFHYNTKMDCEYYNQYEGGADGVGLKQQQLKQVFSKLSICAVDFGLDMSAFRLLFTEEWVHLYHILVRILGFLSWRQRNDMKMVSKYLNLVIVESFEKKKMKIQSDI